MIVFPFLVFELCPFDYNVFFLNNNLLRFRAIQSDHKRNSIHHILGFINVLKVHALVCAFVVRMQQKVSEYDQEIPQSQTGGEPTAP